ncbi:MAG: hypothetical protein KKD48_04900 [Nanoarchaeota archaeon]|nr:hypothetical protein [Nanoarchaeota archaeon]
MGKKAYTKCIELMKLIRKNGFEKEIPFIALKEFIMKEIGGDDRVIQKYFKLLREFGFIKLYGNGVYNIIDIEIKERLY